MKITFYFLILIAFSFCSNRKPVAKYDLVVKSVVKGVFEIPRDSTGKRIYLMELKIINKADTLIEFLTENCTAGENIVYDSKDIIPVVNNCAGNGIAPIFLRPNQEFSLVFMFTTKNKFPKILKIGWILLTREITGSVDNYFNTLEKGYEKFENVIWSNPIELGCCGGFPYEVR
jgi:hypothetical protein